LKKPRNDKTLRVGDLDPHEAREVLHRLWKRGGKLEEAIAEEMEALLRSVDSEAVADRVYSNLDLLTREDLWDRSGRTSHGYNHPAEVSWEMVEETIRPYWQEVERYWKVGMKEEALRCCLGILVGLYDFQMESDSTFKEWAEDDPREAFCWIRGEWEREFKDKTRTSRLDAELSKRCPKWV